MRTYTLMMISGSLRAGSVNEALLNTARQLVPAGVTSHLYGGTGQLPHFNPDDDRAPLHPAVAELRNSIGAADALLFCTPEYAGALPGAFKNLLDWTIGGGELDGKPVAWINTAGVAAPSGGEDAHASLRKVLGYAGARIVEVACARIPVPRQAVSPDGSILDPALREDIRTTVTALMDHLSHPD